MTSDNKVKLVSPQTLMAIKNLELRARVVVEGFWHGLHRSPYHGFSVEFTEYRQYSPGDDPRYLDWRLYARTDRYFIKKFEDETRSEERRVGKSEDLGGRRRSDTKKTAQIRTRM